MPEDVKSRIDVLKTRLVPFIKEGTCETSLKVPNRLLIGFKLNAVAVAIQDLLHEKYNKNLVIDNYEPYGDNDHMFNYKVV
jgi:hypothetical protein